MGAAIHRLRHAMKILTKEIASKLLPYDVASNSPDPNGLTVWLKLFGIGQYGGHDYYIVGADIPDRDNLDDPEIVFYGFCCPCGWDMGEWGEVKYGELMKCKFASIHAIERDLHWTPKTLSDVIATKGEPDAAAAYSQPAYDSKAEEDKKWATDPYYQRRPRTEPQIERFVGGDGLGPIQMSRINKALKALRSAAHPVVTVDSGGYRSKTFIIDFGKTPPRQEYFDEYNAIYKEFGGVATKANANALAKAIEAATKRVEAMQPIIDKRQQVETEPEPTPEPEAKPSQVRFIVASVSLNTSAFGGHGHQIISSDGEVWEGIWQALHARPKGTILSVPCHYTESGRREPNWAKFSLECPELKRTNLPPELMAKAWGDNL